MKSDKIKKAADILYNSRIKLNKIKKLPEDCKPNSIKDAYFIQDELTKKYLSISDNISIIGKSWMF